METAILINEMDETIHLVEIVVQDGEEGSMEFITIDSNSEEVEINESIATNSSKLKMLTQGSRDNANHVDEGPVKGSPDLNEDKSSSLVEIEQQNDQNNDNDIEDDDPLSEIILPQKYCANCSKPLVSSINKTNNCVNLNDDDFNDDHISIKKEITEAEAEQDADNLSYVDNSQKDRQEVYKIKHLNSTHNTNESSVETVKVQNILSSVYKLGYLNSLLNLEHRRDRHNKNDNDDNYGEDEDEELRFDEDDFNISICGRCADSLTSLYKFYTEFNQLRQIDSYLSKRIARLDQLLENQINLMTEETVQKLSMKNTSHVNKTKSGGMKRGRPAKTSESEYKDHKKNKSSAINKIPDSPLTRVPFVKLIRLEDTPESNNYGLGPNRRLKQDNSASHHDLDNFSGNDDEYMDHADGAKSSDDDYFSSGGSEEEDHVKGNHGDGQNSKLNQSPTKRRRKVKKQEDTHKNERKGKESKEDAENIIRKRKKRLKNKFVAQTPATLHCVICSTLMNTSRELTDHYMSHVDQAAGNSLVCPVCVHNVNTTKSSKSEVWTGMGSVNKPFTNKSNLIFHLRLHSGEKPLSCPISDCQQAFVRKNELKIHVVTHDVPPEVRLAPYNCPTCSRSFETAQILKIHIRRHTGDKPYSCSVCQKSFVLSGHLKQHAKTHTGEKPHLCSHCGKAFSTSSSMQRHLRIHTGELPYQCEICLRVFRFQESLTQHSFIHTGEKKFLCTYCGKAFTLSETLKRHLQTHTGARPYKCMFPGCSDSFPDNRPLKRHMLTHGVEATNYIARKSKSESKST